MKIIPINFPAKYEFNGHLIEYRDFKEIGQGGPEIGKLYIDGQPFLPKENFGGPLLYADTHDSIILPIQHLAFFNNGFKIIVIDLKSKNWEILDKKERLILLKSVDEDGTISYYNNQNNTNLKTMKF